MASASLLDFDALLAPIPGDHPEGVSLPFATRKKLEEARKEVDPKSFAEDDPMRPSAPVVADWSSIIKVAQDTLTKTSKDLMVAARLTEALTKSHGFAGARDGLCLFHRLIDDCWDRLQPTIEDGDLEVRAAPLNWLDDVDRGARYPNTIRAAPLVFLDEVPLSQQSWKQLQDGKGELKKEDFDKAVAATPREQCQTNLDDLADSILELDGLVESMTEKMAELAPGMTEVRKALVECQDLANQILQRKGPAPVAAEETPAEQAGDEQPAAKPTRAVAMNTREEVYQQLERAAAHLLQMEPHSPVAYMVLRAVRLGKLPLPELLKVLIRDESTLAQLSRDLDISNGEAG